MSGLADPRVEPEDDVTGEGCRLRRPYPDAYGAEPLDAYGAEPLDAYGAEPLAGSRAEPSPA
jgi:hypothetical protein